MIVLKNNPIEGSTVTLNIQFRDPTGIYYIPISIKYTLLALNSDEESWSVVDGYYKVPLEAASSVALSLPNIETISGTTLKRKVLIEYQAFLNNKYEEFVDEINFDITPKPVISNEPENPPISETYIVIVSSELQTGSVATAPVDPVFKIHVNMPVIIDDANALIYDDNGDDIVCTIMLDNTFTVLTITPNTLLTPATTYHMKLSGLNSKMGEYVLKEPFLVSFVTVSGSSVIQPSKTVEYTLNGDYELLPDENYGSLAKANVIINVPLEETEQIFTENGNFDVEPSSEFEGIKKFTAKVQIPLQDEKNVSLTDNGEYEIVPDDENTAMKKVNVTVDLSGTVQTDKEETITSNGDTTILPDSPFATMDKVVVHTEIPLESDKVETITSNGTTTILPSSGYDGMTKVQVETAIPLEEEMNVSTSSDGVLNITPSDGYTAMKKVVVTVNTGGSKALYAYDGDNDMKFYLTRIIGSTGNYTVLPDPAVSAYEGFDTYHIIKVGSEIQLTYKGTDVMLTRNSSEDIMRE